MNFCRLIRFGLLLLAVWCSLSAAVARGKVRETRFETVELDGKKIEYAVVLPKGFDSDKPYRILLALPPGAQNRQMVNAGLSLYWQRGAETYGWIVISPVAPEGTFFNAGAEKLIPDFLDEIQKTYQPAGGKFHLAGVSNGGTSVFRIAGKYPQRFHSLMALPGYPVSVADKKRLKQLVDLPIAMYAGETDTGWVKPMESTATELRKLGADVQLEIINGEGHVIQNWQDGKKLFGVLNEWHEKAVAEQE